jgi:hypothetical protein
MPLMLWTRLDAALSKYTSLHSSTKAPWLQQGSEVGRGRMAQGSVVQQGPAVSHLAADLVA